MASHSFYCCVDDCSVNVRDNVPFFRCPKDPIRCQQWKDSLGYVGRHNYEKLTPEEAHSRIRICSAHFDDKSFTSSGKRLLYTAVPSKLLPKLYGLIRKPTTPTETQQNDGFEPIEDPGNENALKRKRNEELESTLSNTCENYAQPSTSQSCTIGRSLNPTETYTSYKQKYKELLDAHNSLKQEHQQLKNNIKEKVMGSKEATQSVKRTKVGYARSHSDKEIEELGKYWTQEFSRLKPDQQMYAKEAIEKVFSAGKINNLHSNSVKIDYECDDTVSEETVETKTEIYDANIFLINEDFGDVSVKTEHTGTAIFDDNNDDPITSMNDDFGVAIVKTEETEIEVDDHNNDLNSVKKDFDSISVKNEEMDDIYDETNDSCDQVDHMKIHPEYVAVRVNAGETEIFDSNSVNSDNRCLLKIEKDNSDINVTSEDIEIYDDRKVDVLNIKTEKNQDF